MDLLSMRIMEFQENGGGLGTIYTCVLTNAGCLVWFLAPAIMILIIRHLPFYDMGMSLWLRWTFQSNSPASPGTHHRLFARIYA